jgi:hypothetical protein
MGLTEGSETSAKQNLTPGKYPEEHIQFLTHGESLKSRGRNRTVIGTAIGRQGCDVLKITSHFGSSLLNYQIINTMYIHF